MASWDKDIHRIKEIQELLENRQRYFRGHLKTSFYKLDPNGNPLYFPKLRAPLIGSDSNEPSLGHSCGATYGSTETGSYDPVFNTDTLSKDIENFDKGVHSDSSEGNRADHSQNESSGDSARLVKDVVEKKKVLKKNSKVLRKWVNRNLEAVSSINSSIKLPEKPTPSTSNKNARKSSIIRFKSISFDDNTQVPNKVNNGEIPSAPTPLRPTHKKKSPSPMKLLRRKSWMFKAEVASRLNENPTDLNFNKVIPNLSKTSISLAREKLKKAEKSLRATVRNEQSGPLLKKLSIPKKTVESKPQKLSQSRLAESRQNAVSVKKPSGGCVPNRLALRHQEEVIKHDLNLREAFALIKIDPEPLLNLASTELEQKPAASPKTTGSVGMTMQSIIKRGPLTEQKFRRSFALEDSATSQSLKRLTKLSIQHLQKQHSLVPNTAQTLQLQKGTKNAEGKTKSSTGKNTKSQKKTEQSVDSTRRKSQANILLNQQQARRRSSNIFANGHAYTLEQQLTGGRKNSKSEKEYNLFTIDRLDGTVI